MKTKMVLGLNNNDDVVILSCVKTAGQLQRLCVTLMALASEMGLDLDSLVVAARKNVELLPPEDVCPPFIVLGNSG